MADAGSLTVHVQAETHGALEDSRIGVMRRMVALWLIAIAQRLLKTRIDIHFIQETQ